MRDSKLPLRARFTLIAAALLIAAPAGFALAGSAHLLGIALIVAAIAALFFGPRARRT